MAKRVNYLVKQNVPKDFAATWRPARLFPFHRFFNSYFQPKSRASECRGSTNICDLAEFCNGETEDCPADFFVQDGRLCPDSAEVQSVQYIFLVSLFIIRSQIVLIRTIAMMENVEADRSSARIFGVLKVHLPFRNVSCRTNWE